MDLTNYELLDIEKFSNIFNIPKKINCKNFEDINVLLEDENYENQGIIIKFNNKRFKLRNLNYIKVRYLRGNTNSLKYRYLELKKEKKIKLFLKYYPEYIKNFNEYNNIFQNIVKKLHNLYTQKYIKKINIKVNKTYKYILYNIHSIYLKNKNLITQSVIINFLNSLNCSELYSLIFKE